MFEVDRPRRPNVDVDVFTTSTACCGLDIWPPESNQIISRDGRIYPTSFIKTAQAVHEISW